MKPLFSVVLVLKNGMPYLPEAVQSVLSQTYSDFEMIVQDGGSTDGSLDVLKNFGDSRIKIQSKRDRGIGQAYARAFSRCRGDIICSIDADNLFEWDALQIALDVFKKNPSAAAIYGECSLIDGKGQIVARGQHEPFDVERLRCCLCVPPFSTSFFSKRNCGKALRSEAHLKTCADYDLWLRLSNKQILKIDHFLGKSRISAKSMTCTPERYDQFCRDKVWALKRHARKNKLSEAAFSEAIGGIYLWAARSLFQMGDRSSRFYGFFREGKKWAPQSVVVRDLEFNLNRENFL